MTRYSLIVIALLMLLFETTLIVSQDNYKVVTIAGESTNVGDGLVATQGILFKPVSISQASNGDIFMAIETNNRIRKVSNGIISSVAGNGTNIANNPYGKPATTINIGSPTSVAVHPITSEVYYSVLQRIIKVDSNGLIVAVAGYLQDSKYETKLGTMAGPKSLVFNSAGDLFFSDNGVSIRKIGRDFDRIETLVGRSGGARTDGPALEVSIVANAVTIGPLGELYFCDQLGANFLLRKVSNDYVTTLKTIQDDTCIGISSSGQDIYIAGLTKIIKYSTNGELSTFAGKGTYGTSGDGGLAIDAVTNPLAVLASKNGQVYIADSFGRSIRVVSNSTGYISTFAGGSVGDGRLVSETQLYQPSLIAPSPDGGFLFVTNRECRIRKVSANGILSTAIGGMSCGAPTENSQASQNLIDSIYALTSTPRGEIIFGTYEYIRKIDANGIFSNVAGCVNSLSCSNSAVAKKTVISEIRGLSISGNGDIYYAEGGGKIARIFTNSTVTRLGGPASTVANCNSQVGGLAIKSEFCEPYGVSLLSNGDLLVVETEYSRVLKISASTGIKSVFAGGGMSVSEGDLAVNVKLTKPKHVVVNSKGEAFMYSGNTLKKVTTDGKMITITSDLNSPISMTINANDQIYLVETGRIRKFIPVSNTGDCLSGFYGKDCDLYSCFNFNNTDSSACSSNGYCNSPNKCTCKAYYSGNQCENYSKPPAELSASPNSSDRLSYANSIGEKSFILILGCLGLFHLFMNIV